MDEPALLVHVSHANYALDVGILSAKYQYTGRARDAAKKWLAVVCRTQGIGNGWLALRGHTLSFARLGCMCECSRSPRRGRNRKSCHANGQILEREGAISIHVNTLRCAVSIVSIVRGSHVTKVTNALYAPMPTTP